VQHGRRPRPPVMDHSSSSSNKSLSLSLRLSESLSLFVLQVFTLFSEGVCVYYCSAYYKAVGVGGGG